MTVAIIKLSPGTTPENFSRTTQQTLPDGVGLQIFFEVNGEYYLIAGPRAGGRVTAVNGGKIENNAHSFYAQFAEELYEETFGYLRIESGDHGWVLVIGDDRYALEMLEDQVAFEKNDTYNYSYVTFTAVCRDLSREDLHEVAALLSPTAAFWNKIGNYLHQQCQAAPCHECGDFKKFWQLGYEKRNELITEWIGDYYQIFHNGGLLIDPQDVFKRKRVEEALATLHTIENAEQLGHVFHRLVGNYSERSGYHVFKASDLMQAAQSGSNEVKDVNGAVVARGIYYSEVVATLYPALLMKPEPLQSSPLMSHSLLKSVKIQSELTVPVKDTAPGVIKHY